MHSQPALRQAYLGNGKKPSVNGGKLATKIFTDNCYFDFPDFKQTKTPVS
jgi:hypothetical protein